MNVSTIAKPAPNGATPATPKAAPLAPFLKVTNTRKTVPLALVVYGVEGLGKSTLGACAPDPVFLPFEDGLSEIDTQALEIPRTFEETEASIASLMTTRHDFRTLVVDTLDGLEPLLHAAVCDAGDEKGKKHKSIEAFGYGKGYTRALDWWRRFLRQLDGLREKRGMNVILLSHAKIKNFKNPEGDDYDRYTMKLHDAAAGLVRDWSQATLFAKLQTFTREVDEGKAKSKGVSDGKRVLCTQREAAWDAKNRFGLPPQLPLDWDELYAAIRARAPEEAPALRARIESMLAEIEVADADYVAKVRPYVEENADDSLKLSRVANKVAAHLSLTATTKEATI